jgi:hypothetical protein
MAIRTTTTIRTIATMFAPSGYRAKPCSAI